MGKIKTHFCRDSCDTGAINPVVADAWEKYDIAEVIRSHAKTLGPKLQDHIHLTVGTADTFHLDEPARLLDQTLQELGIRAQFTYIEGGTHFDLYQGGLTIKIANEACLWPTSDCRVSASN